MKQKKTMEIMLLLSLLFLLFSFVCLFRGLPGQKKSELPSETLALREGRQRADAEALRIHLNKADADELCSLPGIGQALAERIVEYRQEKGAIRSYEELGSIEGIGEKKQQMLRQYTCLED